MERSSLVKLFGFPATLIHGDTLVLDRWLWLKKHLPVVATDSKRLLDVGCGTGAFTIGAARRGYLALGLSWDVRNQLVAAERAAMCKSGSAIFEVQDVRYLDERTDLREQFDVAICCENIEHILNDRKLVVDVAACLKTGGILLLTTPNFYYRPITREDNGPWSKVEDGGHVRRGYKPEALKELCAEAGLKVSVIEFCSGFLSQKITALMRTVSKVHPLLGWTVAFPLRVLPPLLDPWLARASRWPGFSITLVAVKG